MPHSRDPKWDTGNDEEMMRDYVSGVPQRLLGDRYGVSKQTIYKHACRIAKDDAMMEKVKAWTKAHRRPIDRGSVRGLP